MWKIPTIFIMAEQKEPIMAKQPNVLFLLSDQHSYRCFSHLDPNGEGEPVHTPTLDGLAAQATAFHQTYCQVAVCTASRICLLTGLSPMRSGGWTNGFYLKPGNQTLPETFAAAGYTTCLVGKMRLGAIASLSAFNEVGLEQSRKSGPRPQGFSRVRRTYLSQKACFMGFTRHLPENPWGLPATLHQPYSTRLISCYIYACCGILQVWVIFDKSFKGFIEDAGT
jgi:hypothetical protein